jgi:hypothetical protein
MHTNNWQKSSYSGNSANCLYIAATQNGTVKLRESDTPDTILATAPEALKALIHQVKAGELRSAPATVVRATT